MKENTLLGVGNAAVKGPEVMERMIPKGHTGTASEACTRPKCLQIPLLQMYAVVLGKDSKMPSQIDLSMN